MHDAYDKWKATVDRAKTDPTWDAYDLLILQAVAEYNGFLVGKSGFLAVNWKMVKAIIWTETGPYTEAWNSRPMQIGNHGDRGLAALLSKTEGGDLIIPPSFRPSLNVASVRAVPLQNIRAGIGYLLMRSARFQFAVVPDAADSSIHPYTVGRGDSLFSIARREGTTIQTLKELNPEAGILHSKQVLQFRKAATKKQIVGWNSINVHSIAMVYNTHRGDPRYEQKLTYCLSVIDQLKKK